MNNDQSSAEQNEASDSPGILFLMGKPGLGKSTLLEALTKIRGNSDTDSQSRVVPDIESLPSTRRAVAKRGIRVNYVYYWHSDFQNPEILGTLVPVRYNPNNFSIVYAYIKTRWVECVARDNPDLKGRAVDKIKALRKASRVKS